MRSRLVRQAKLAYAKLGRLAGPKDDLRVQAERERLRDAKGIEFMVLYWVFTRRPSLGGLVCYRESLYTTLWMLRGKAQL
jgi:hypothetical protein